MSRRESRNSLGARQSNALEEFENFKKKYLLVNKHIAKLNSSLNVRIEELLSQIAVLNNDNLRLRASELSLARRLANEQDRTRRLYREAESASKLLMEQVNTMKTMFGLDKPANPVTLKAVVVNRPKPTKPSQPPASRFARVPEVDTITEAVEEETSPSRTTGYKDSPLPVASSTTPSRRRSTGSTPRSTPASNTPDNEGLTRSNSEPRKSTPPVSMDITSSSPLSPSPLFSVSAKHPPSPSPIAVSTKEGSVVSPPTVDGNGGEKEVGEKRKEEEPSSVSSTAPHLNLTGMRRIVRRPSGLLLERSVDFDTVPKTVAPAGSVSLPPTEPGTTASPVAYPTPNSVSPTPSTPPRQPMPLQDSEDLTPNGKLPMSPVLAANPALSPPPARKLSLTRRQLDFGLPDSDEEGLDKDDEEENGRNSDPEGSPSWQNDNRPIRRATKRKALDEEDVEPFYTAEKPSSKASRRRDTGTFFMGLSLKGNGSKASLTGDAMESKESLRDMTNERSSSPLLVAHAEDFENPQVISKMKLTTNGTTTRSETTGTKGGHMHHISEGIAARLEKLKKGTRAEAPRLNPVPLPSPERIASRSQSHLHGEMEEVIKEQEPDSPMRSTMDLGRRNSGRVRKSVNYKEPSLVTKMRKPDPVPNSSGSVAASSSTNHRPPRRKKGSISLAEDVNGASAGASTGGIEPSKVATESERVRRLADGMLRRKRSTRNVEFDPSSDDSLDDDLQFPVSGSANASKTSLNGGIKGSSILLKGSNPMIGNPSSAYPLFPSPKTLEPVSGPGREGSQT